MSANKIIGLFLISEGLLSIIYSQDRQNISQFGRVGRICIGIYLIVKK